MTSRNQQLFEKSQKLIPGGVNSPVRAFKSVGGTPHLDGNYTVFGQVISGLAVLDSIAHQPKDRTDCPLKDIRMSMKVEKMKKKKIAKRYGYRFE